MSMCQMYLDRIEKLTKEGEDEHSHLLDRIEAYLELSFAYGQDRHNAAKATRKALDLCIDERRSKR